MTRSGVPSARVAIDWPIDSRITLPPPNTASSPGVGPAARSSVTSMNSSVSASRTRSPTVGPYKAAYRARLSSLIQRPRRLGTRTRHDPPSGQWHQADRPRDAGFEAHRRPGRNVEPMPPRRVPVERQRGVRRREVIVRAHLDRAVAGVLHDQVDVRAPGVELDHAVDRHHLARDDGHGIGSWIVTSLVPSGNVASTCTDSIISGTPSITSARVSTERPALIRSATVRPSRAPSSTNDVRIA